MKRSFFVSIICLIVCFSLLAQSAKTKNVYEMNGYYLSIIDSVRFEIFEVLERSEATYKGNGLWNLSPQTERVLSEGRITKKNNKIICHDSKLNRYYTFTQINDSLLVATKYTVLFTKGDKLKWIYGW